MLCLVEHTRRLHVSGWADTLVLYRHIHYRNARTHNSCEGCALRRTSVGGERPAANTHDRASLCSHSCSEEVRSAGEKRQGGSKNRHCCNNITVGSPVNTKKKKPARAPTRCMGGYYFLGAGPLWAPCGGGIFTLTRILYFGSRGCVGGHSYRYYTGTIGKAQCAVRPCTRVRYGGV